MDMTSYLDRMLEPVTACFTPDVAAKVMHLQPDQELQDRIDELATKCTEGELSDEERAEYETYVRAGNLIAILQAKSRRLFGDNDGS